MKRNGKLLVLMASLMPLTSLSFAEQISAPPAPEAARPVVRPKNSGRVVIKPRRVSRAPATDDESEKPTDVAGLLDKLGFRYQGYQLSTAMVPPDVNAFSVTVKGGLKEYAEQIDARIASAFVSRDVDPELEKQSREDLLKYIESYLVDSGFEVSDKEVPWELVVIWGKDEPGGELRELKKGVGDGSLSTQGRAFFLDKKNKLIAFSDLISAEVKFTGIGLAREGLGKGVIIPMFAQTIVRQFEEGLVKAKTRND